MKTLAVNWQHPWPQRLCRLFCQSKAEEIAEANALRAKLGLKPLKE